VRKLFFDEVNFQGLPAHYDPSFRSTGATRTRQFNIPFATDLRRAQLINSFAAEHGIALFLLPPHGSHLLQRLDQGFVRRVKVQFGRFRRIKKLSKVTSTCECVFMALQAMFITRIIWNSWRHSGIVPVIESFPLRETQKQNTPAKILMSALSTKPVRGSSSAQ
jgi:hypothetical protein